MREARFVDLVDATQVRSIRGELDIAIRGVATDSRRVGAGELFVCLPGYRAPGGEVLQDRHDFAQAAAERGAAGFVVQRDVAGLGDLPVVRVDDTWAAAAYASARFFGDPSRSHLVVGVTGTSGKTTTSYFVDAVLRAAGHRVARLGTIDYRIGDRVLPAEQTTPEAPVLQQLLRDAVDDGCTATVTEVSSHALELRRAAEVDFDIGVFTNLSRDHLNFHPDMDSYLAAKARLFDSLRPDATAIVNFDDPASKSVIRGCRASLLSFGTDPRADVAGSRIKSQMSGLSFDVRALNQSVRVSLPHLGEFNVHNALAAFAVGVAVGMPAEEVAHALGRAEAVPGRFEVVDDGQDFVVVVDYAHKPVALERLLESARQLNPRRLITLFGCGGDRDRGKRAVMGRIASSMSDFVVVTSDNPRGEDHDAIIAEILVGSREHDPMLSRHLVEKDRGLAIQAAIDRARAGDLVVVAGKGHEPYQLVAGVRLDFDDREHARAAIAARASA